MTSSPRRSRRSPRSTSASSTRPRSTACRWAITSSGSAPAAGSRSRRIRRWPCRPALRPTGCRSACSSSAATAARPTCCDSRMPWPETPPTAAHRAAYRDAEPLPFWRRPATEPAAPLLGRTDADLCIVGGGFTGLWAALYAKEHAPERDVVLLEAETAGFGASGRNGGFVIASLTHGIDNGLARFASEMPALERLALENSDGLVSDFGRHGIDCNFEPTGELLAL